MIFMFETEGFFNSRKREISPSGDDVNERNFWVLIRFSNYPHYLVVLEAGCSTTDPSLGETWRSV